MDVIININKNIWRASWNFAANLNHMNQAETKHDVFTRAVIAGEFSPEEANEILGHLLQEKINFHQRKSLQHDLKYGSPLESSVQREIVLKEIRSEMEAYLKEATYDGVQLRVRAVVEIERIEK